MDQIPFKEFNSRNNTVVKTSNVENRGHLKLLVAVSYGLVRRQANDPPEQTEEDE